MGKISQEILPGNELSEETKEIMKSDKIKTLIAMFGISVVMIAVGLCADYIRRNTGAPVKEIFTGSEIIAFISSAVFAILGMDVSKEKIPS